MIKMKLKIIFATSQSFESKEVKVRSTYFEQKNTTNEIYKFKKKNTFLKFIDWIWTLT